MSFLSLLTSVIFITETPVSNRKEITHVYFWILEIRFTALSLFYLIFIFSVNYLHQSKLIPLYMHAFKKLEINKNMIRATLAAKCS